MDVACFTFLQRSVDAHVRGRVFGVIEGLTVGIGGIGALAAAPLISAFGVRASLIGFGGSLTALTFLSTRRLGSMEVPNRSGPLKRHLIEGVAFLAVLPPAAIDDLAERLRLRELNAGDVLFREGDPGEGFYIIESGEVSVIAGSSHLADLGPGDYVGEIALLRGAPRMATVKALTDVAAYRLDRSDFVDRVSRDPASEEIADAVIVTRLGSVRPRLVSP